MIFISDCGHARVARDRSALVVRFECDGGNAEFKLSGSSHLVRKHADKEGLANEIWARYVKPIAAGSEENARKLVMFTTGECLRILQRAGETVEV